MDFVDSTCYTKSIGYAQYFVSYFVVFWVFFEVCLGESLFFGYFLQFCCISIIYRQRSFSFIGVRKLQMYLEISLDFICK